jgi:hypothetical protein
VRNIYTSSRARGARRAPGGALISRELARPYGRCDGERSRRGHKRPRESRRMEAGSSALAPCGARRAAARALPRHCPSPVGRRHAAERTARGDGHPPAAIVLSRAKITVKSAPACGLRVLRMALRATLDCDLRASHDGAYRKDGQDQAVPNSAAGRCSSRTASQPQRPGRREPARRCLRTAREAIKLTAWPSGRVGLTPSRVPFAQMGLSQPVISIIAKLSTGAVKDSKILWPPLPKPCLVGTRFRCGATRTKRCARIIKGG